ncbi:MAG: FAD-binding protein, partial [Sphingomonadaceae bacterium]
MAAAQVQMPQPAGRLTRKAPLAPLTWFRTGGAADWLFEPKDEADLAAFLAALDPQVPVMALGLGSNLIVRDGGVEGVVVRLGKAFAGVAVEGLEVTAGGGAAGIAVASAARDAGVGGLAFLRGIPGTVGGFVRMN